jgi:predicted MFS family arabinose efflux permease
MSVARSDRRLLVTIAAWGMAAPFWMNAMTTLGVIAALIWWHPSGEGTGRHLPP